MGVIFRVGPNSLVVVVVVVTGGWEVGSARLLAESGMGASCTAVVLEIIAAPERDTNNNSDMAGKDVGFIFAIIPPRRVDQNCDMFGLVKAKCDAIFFFVEFGFLLADGNLSVWGILCPIPV